MERSVKVLMVGSTTNVKGGMTTVVQSFLQHPFGPGIDLKFIPTHSEKGALYNIGFFAISLARILIYFTFKKPQIVHMHMSERGSFMRKYIVFKLSKAFGIKVLVHTHGAEFKEFYENSASPLRRRVSDLLKNADRVIALGKSWEMALKEIEPETDTAILMNSVPVPDLQKPLKTETEFNILFLAVLTERKGILDLIHASVPVIRQAKNNGQSVIFHIAGDGELKDAATELVSSLHIEDSYKFYGWVDASKKKELLETADLFVLPSYNEGLPMSILEALSYGMPVLSTTVGSIDEAVVEGGNGYLIEAGDVEALAEKMIAVINDDDLSAMGKRSRELAENKFNAEMYFQQVENLYQTVKA